MTVKALTPVRWNLVAPLAHKATATHTLGNRLARPALSGAVDELIGASLRRADVDSATSARTPGCRTSTTATRTGTTSTTRTALGPSASSYLFSQLVQAYIDCRRTKRNSASALAFEARLERELCDLHEDLVSGAYRPGRSTCFVARRPKPREIWAAGFRDRVVHHLLYNQISPSFYASFTADSCACIPGRGTLYAACRLEHQVRSITRNWSRPAFYLKCDLANFFVAIDKNVLREQLVPRIDGAWWQQLAETVLFHDPREDVEVRSPPAVMRLVPPHKSLFNAPADTGLPIGNLSSQFFANVYLDALDQFVKHKLRAPRYVRYVDDFVLLHESSAALVDWLNRIGEFLPARLGAHLNPRKTVLQPADRGIDFVGHVIKPWRRIPRANALPNALRRLQQTADADYIAAANSYFGLLRQSQSSHHIRADLANSARRRGFSVSADLTKAYAKASA
jgi:retron-type reverse transcriptase